MGAPAASVYRKDTVMARPLFLGSLAAALVAGTLIALPAFGQAIVPSGGGGGGGGGAPAMGSSGGTFRSSGGGGGGGAMVAPRGGGAPVMGSGRSTFRSSGGGGGGAAIVPGGGGRGYAGRGYRHHGHYYRGPAVVGSGWGWGWGAPYYYDDYSYAAPSYYGYERCYTRRVKVRGHWVRRRYCEY